MQYGDASDKTPRNLYGMVLRLSMSTAIAAIILTFSLRSWNANRRAADEWARRIAGGDWMGHEVFYQAPLYPYFLAVIYKIFGESVVDGLDEVQSATFLPNRLRMTTA